MLRIPVLFLLFSAFALGSALAQSNPATQPQNQSEPQAQTKPGANANTAQTRETEGGNVLILKAPEMPKAQQFKPELRAVDLKDRPKLSEPTKMRLIQLLDAEFAHTRKYFPLGDRSIVISPQGEVSPVDAALFQLTQKTGQAAKIGDRVQVTNIFIREKSIILQINGGPKKKGSKWYQHVSIGMGGPGGGVAPLDNQAQATGAEFKLEFDKQVPEMNADELRKLLSPVLDFSVKTAGQVYAETLPPKIRDAIKNHQVLVGMNRDMVVMAKDRPQQKVRDKDENGKDYEEWIYGAPPQEVVLVRFIGDEATQVKIARVGQQTIVKTEKEVDVKDGVVTLASLAASNSPQDAKQTPAEEEQAPRKPPTLRRPGEEPEQPEAQRAPNGPVARPPQSEPEWGTGGKKPDDSDQQQPPQEPAKPPL